MLSSVNFFLFFFLKTRYNSYLLPQIKDKLLWKNNSVSTLGIYTHVLVDFDIGWYNHDTISGNGLLQNKYWKQLYIRFCSCLGVLKDSDKTIHYYTLVRQVNDCVWLHTVNAMFLVCICGQRLRVKNLRSACRSQNYDIKTNPYCNSQDFLHVLKSIQCTKWDLLESILLHLFI